MQHAMLGAAITHRTHGASLDCIRSQSALSQVSIDGNAALMGALTGIAALPQDFYNETCPTPQQLKALAVQTFRRNQNKAPVKAPE